jgi:hypothetical protein
VDDLNRISGVIDVRHYSQDAVDFERREAAERMFQLLGFHIESTERGIWHAFASRFPWMLCNIASGLAAAAITGHYSDVLKHTVALAFSLSVVLGIAESVSMQSVSIGLQSLDRKVSPWQEMRMGPVHFIRQVGVVKLFCFQHKPGYTGRCKLLRHPLSGSFLRRHPQDPSTHTRRMT